MPLESAADFSSYVDPQIGGVTATFSEMHVGSLWDSRIGLIDSYIDIDSFFYIRSLPFLATLPPSKYV